MTKIKLGEDDYRLFEIHVGRRRAKQIRKRAEAMGMSAPEAVAIELEEWLVNQGLAHCLVNEP